ncbi:hypothetical protein TNCV_3935511 [Trichonephila clavipes]|nr:hypothetical protein TNCV_3935511 [Trichonephila clavipes]
MNNDGHSNRSIVSISDGLKDIGTELIELNIDLLKECNVCVICQLQSQSLKILHSTKEYFHDDWVELLEKVVNRMHEYKEPTSTLLMSTRWLDYS